MTTEWREFTFSELIESGALEIGDGYRAKLSELGGDGPIFLRAGHVTDTHIDFGGVDRFHRDAASVLASKMSRPGDVIVTTKGNSTGRVAFVDSGMPSFVYSPHLSYWRSLDRDRIIPGFLRYWSRSQQFRNQLAGLAASTDMAPYLSLVDQRRLRIILPSSEEQRTISQVLGRLDDKIELNRRMNETLEAMARAIFKSWFVDFDPVRAKAQGRRPFRMDAETAALFPSSFEDSCFGKIPRGWNVIALDHVCKVIDCLHSKKPDRQESGKPFLQLWNIRDDGLIDMADTYWITEEDYQRWIFRMEAGAGDCVITNVGRVGAVAQMPEGLKAALGRNMTGIRCREAFPFPTFLIECLLSSAMREEINLRTDSGTILDSLNVRNIPTLRLVNSPAALCRSFETTCRPLRARMETNQSENTTLAAIRDALLPKLISGEIRVSETDRVAVPEM